MKTRELVRVRLVNIQTLGARCGWGTGRTREQAIANALILARQDDPKAWYDKQSGVVTFRGGINC